jgi:subtilisin family serine protease
MQARRRSRPAISFVLAVAMGWCFGATPAVAQEASPPGWSDQLIVTYLPGAAKELPLGVRAVRTGANFAVVKLGRRAVPSDLRRFTSPDVVSVEPDRWKTVSDLPDDPRFDEQWGVQDQTAPGGLGGFSVRAEGAWEISTGSPDITVAVLDTGITDHPDLENRIVAGYDFVRDLSTANDGNGLDSDPSDPGDSCDGYPSSWHGTHVAGIIGAEAGNDEGIVGLNWVSPIQPVRVLGVCGGYTSDVADGIRWAAGGTVAGVPNNPTPARVINLSLGGWGPCSTAERSAIDYAVGRGALVVVAAGNEEDDAANYSPANCPDVIVVAATNQDGKKSWYSNYGEIVTVAAPGGDDEVDSEILSTLNDGLDSPGDPTYRAYQGTSMATPHVAGVLSLLLSVAPELELADILALLETTSQAFPEDLGYDSCSDPGMCGSGIIDAAELLYAVGTGDTAQSIDFDAPPTKYLGEAPFDPGAEATSHLPITYGATPTNVCDYRGNKVYLLHVGTCTLIARQRGDATYSRAEPVERTFDIESPFAPTVVTDTSFDAVPRVEVSVTLTEGTWSGGPSPALSYQWYRCTLAGAAVTQGRPPTTCSVIGGARSASYTPGTVDLGRRLRLAVKATNLAARSGIVRFSAASDQVVGAPTRSRGGPSVTASPRVGRLATLGNSGVLGTAPIAFEYSWYSCTAPVSASTSLSGLCSVIDGESGTTFTPGIGLVGRFIVVGVTSTNAYGSITNYSASSRAVR